VKPQVRSKGALIGASVLVVALAALVFALATRSHAPQHAGAAPDSSLAAVSPFAGAPPSSSAAPPTPSLTATTTAPAPSPSGPARAGDAPACAGSVLQAQLKVDGTVGKATGAIGLRNQSAAACTVTGFPDLQLLGRGDDPISTRAAPTAGSPAAVRLEPGATAWSPVTWSTVASADEASPCEPAAERLAVFAPGDKTQLNVAYSAGPVCDHGLIQVGPFSARVS
jgi:hypothetical protein